MSTLTQEVDLLKKIPLFANIDPGKLKLLAFASDRKVYKDGQDLIKQGEIGDSAHVIVEGNAQIIVGVDGKEIIVAELGNNEIIGEISILCDIPRTATVRADGEVVALKIKKEHFVGMINQAPELGIEVMRELAERLTKTTAELSEARRQLASVQ